MKLGHVNVLHICWNETSNAGSLTDGVEVGGGSEGILRLATVEVDTFGVAAVVSVSEAKRRVSVGSPGEKLLRIAMLRLGSFNCGVIDVECSISFTVF